MLFKVTTALWLTLPLFLSPAYAVDAAESALPSSVKLSYQALHGSAPKALAVIGYDPKSLKTAVTSWTPPVVEPSISSTEPQSSPLIKVVVPSGGSTVTSLATFNTTLNQTVSLWLSPTGDGSVLSASVSASAPLTPKQLKEKAREERRIARAKAQSQKMKKRYEESQEKSSGNVWIDLRVPVQGPLPVLQDRKPAVVGADGQEVPEQQEKSFFQKYWWVLLIGAVFALQGGGDK